MSSLALFSFYYKSFTTVKAKYTPCLIITFGGRKPPSGEDLYWNIKTTIINHTDMTLVMTYYMTSVMISDITSVIYLR